MRTIWNRLSARRFERPEFSDIKAMIHPATGAVYLYSDKYLDGERAFMMMDYEEVIKPGESLK